MIAWSKKGINIPKKKNTHDIFSLFGDPIIAFLTIKVKKIFVIQAKPACSLSEQAVAFLS